MVHTLARAPQETWYTAGHEGHRRSGKPSRILPWHAAHRESPFEVFSTMGAGGASTGRGTTPRPAWTPPAVPMSGAGPASLAPGVSPS